MSRPVCIVVNEGRDAGFKYADEVARLINGRGREAARARAEEIPENAEFCVVLGGDGTMLRAARFAAPMGVPLLGINLGNVGYLTDADENDGLESVSKVLAGKFFEEKRLMLEVCSGGLSKNDSLALNDVYVSRGGFGKLMSFSVYINGQFIEGFRADGVIVSTPTGSTAYNLSAGGPILTPCGEMAVITAVCPHSLYARPWVISSEDSVRVCAGTGGRADVVIDGEMRLGLAGGEGVEIKASKNKAVIIKTSEHHFYEILRGKI